MLDFGLLGSFHTDFYGADAAFGDRANGGHLVRFLIAISASLLNARFIRSENSFGVRVWCSRLVSLRSGSRLGALCV